jgi:hypothetical protein
MWLDPLVGVAGCAAKRIVADEFIAPIMQLLGMMRNCSPLDVRTLKGGIRINLVVRSADTLVGILMQSEVNVDLCNHFDRLTVE